MKLNEITGRIINAAFQVHSTLGPGLFEQIYKECLAYELTKQGLELKKELPLPVVYDSKLFKLAYRIDLLVESEIIVELKAVEHISNFHKVQLYTYPKLAQKQVGLLLNFHAPHLKDGISRIVCNYKE